MKLTKAKLQKIIKEEIAEMTGMGEDYPKVRQLLGDDLYHKVFAKMEELQNVMNRNHEMAGNMGGPYPKDSSLFLKALEEVF